MAMMSALTYALLPALALVPTAPSEAAVTPPKAGVSATIAAVNGSGCPTGTTTVSLAAGNTALLVDYDSFIASIGPAAKVVDYRKNCQLNVKITKPAGYTFAVGSTRLNGSGQLRQGVSATLRFNTFFSGMVSPGYLTKNFSGPQSGSWTFTGSISAVYAPCGQQPYLILNTELRFPGSTDDPAMASRISLTPAGAAHSTRTELLWSAC